VAPVAVKTYVTESIIDGGPDLSCSTIPRYFFHVRDNNNFAEDLEGEEFSNLDAAVNEASEVARELLAERVRTGRSVWGCTIELVDAGGSVLKSLPWVAVLK
jgi:hypothetical protein